MPTTSVANNSGATIVRIRRMKIVLRMRSSVAAAGKKYPNAPPMTMAIRIQAVSEMRVSVPPWRVEMKDLSRIAGERRGRGSRRHLKREAERRDAVAGMIARIRELRQAIELLPAIRSLVDARVKIDHVKTGPAGCREIDDDVAARVEAAGVTHVGVVV